MNKIILDYLKKMSSKRSHRGSSYKYCALCVDEIAERFNRVTIHEADKSVLSYTNDFIIRAMDLRKLRAITRTGDYLSEKRSHQFRFDAAEESIILKMRIAQRCACREYISRLTGQKFFLRELH